MKVCFFSPTAYAYFNPSGDTWAGGAEVQQVLAARYMVSRGIDVSFIVGDYGQPDAELIDGITMIKSFEPFRGNRKIRFFPDMLKIRRAMQIADADVYNQRSTAFYTGQLAYFASRMNRIFTFSIGIDYNCYPDCNGLLTFPLTRLYRYGLEKADAVIAQTDRQRRLLQRNFGIEAVLIRNGVEIPPPDGDTPAPDRRDSFLWVGSFRRRKRPDIYVELARRIPEADFMLIGGRGDDPAFFEQVTRGTAAVSNIHYLGFVPPAQMDRYYRRAYALINTSYLEGFPNTYLHAWVHGVPTLTIEIDPDRIIERFGIGETTKTFDGLVAAVRRLHEEPSRRSGMSERARRYVRENHDIADRGEDYIRLFESLLQSSEKRASRRSG